MLENSPGTVAVAEAVHRIKAHGSMARILVFSSHADTHIIQRALEAGATGCPNKQDSRQMAGAVLKAARGEMSWT